MQAIDFEEGTLSVREAAELTKEFGLRYKAPKSRTSQREVPFHSILAEALKTHKAHQDERRSLLGSAYQDHDLVFCCEDGSPKSPSALSSAFAHIRERAGSQPSGCTTSDTRSRPW
jgi:hypothetical protein